MRNRISQYQTSKSAQSEDLESFKKAVLYLRVSSKKQMYTAIDIDADGNSIATQRETTIEKAREKNATIVREFIEPGASAKTIEKRPVFKELLQYLVENKDIDYVIVYMRSRAFRNHFDAAIVGRQLEALGVRLLSVKEDFGEGPHAVAMEGFTDIMNGLQNTLSGLDIQTKLRHKAVNGGTIGRARLGYLNARVEHEGRMINTITTDPKRAPLIRKAWEMYATGDYSIDRLTATMADYGLTSRPSPRWPTEQPVSDTKLHQMLRDPYYAGWLVYKGEIYPGRHEGIVDQQLFDRVQDVLDARSRHGQRDRVHTHYLKGILYCARCADNGRTSRMIYTEAKGRNGTKYPYFLCRSKQEKICDLPHLNAKDVENAIVANYQHLQLPDGFASDIEDRLNETMRDEQRSVHDLHAALTRKLTDLRAKEERLIDLAADGEIPQARIRARLHNLERERQAAQLGMSQTTGQLNIGAQLVRSAIRLTQDPQSLYAQVPNSVRRQLNQTFYESIEIDDLGTVRPTLTPLFNDLHSGARARNDAISNPDPPISSTYEKRSHQVEAFPSSTSTGLLTIADLFSVGVSSRTVMVGRAGLEPATNGL